MKITLRNMVSKSEQSKNKNKNIVFQKKEGKRKKPLKLPIGGWTFIPLFLVCVKRVGETLKLVKAVSDNYMCYFKGGSSLSKRTEGHYLPTNNLKKDLLPANSLFAKHLESQISITCGLNPIVMCCYLLLCY